MKLVVGHGSPLVRSFGPRHSQATVAIAHRSNYVGMAF